jgi:hypothetical protein
MLTETKAIEVLVCETSISGFESRQSPQMEGAAEWTATGLENQGKEYLGVRSLHLPLDIRLMPKSEALY